MFLNGKTVQVDMLLPVEKERIENANGYQIPRLLLVEAVEKVEADIIITSKLVIVVLAVEM